MLDRLETSFSQLRQFSDDIAHELRTPINSMLVATEVALNKARTIEAYRDVLESNLEDCGRLRRTVESLLFLARAENPKTKIECETGGLQHELSLIHEFYEAAATEADLHFSISCDPNLKASVDRMLLQRAISNLVANAIAHTPCGGTVSVGARDDGEFVLIEVSDTGRGIAPEHLPFVFDRLYRVDQTRSTGNAHLGLGLSIVKSVATLHGGTVHIGSMVAEGSRVTLRFPKARQAFAQSQDYGIVNQA
jgi:two-component system heavy metal sensor histidine kinase CusS